MCEKQKDIEDTFESSCSYQSDSKNIQSSHHSSQRSGEEKLPFMTEAKSSQYGAISPLADVDESLFDGLKDVEELTLGEYLQGDSHQLTRHVILILFLCFFSILVSRFSQYRQ